MTRILDVTEPENKFATFRAYYEYLKRITALKHPKDHAFTPSQKHIGVCGNCGWLSESVIAENGVNSLPEFIRKALPRFKEAADMESKGVGTVMYDKHKGYKTVHIWPGKRS